MPPVGAKGVARTECGLYLLLAHQVFYIFIKKRREIFLKNVQKSLLIKRVSLLAMNLL